MIIIADAGPLLHLFWVDALAWALPPQEIVVVEQYGVKSPIMPRRLCETVACGAVLPLVLRRRL